MVFVNFCKWFLYHFKNCKRCNSKIAFDCKQQHHSSIIRILGLLLLYADSCAYCLVYPLWLGISDLHIKPTFFFRGGKIQKIGQMPFPSASLCTHLLTLLFGFMTTWCSHGMRVELTCEFELMACVCLIVFFSLSLLGALLLFTRPFNSSRPPTLSNIFCIADWLLAAVNGV